MPSRVYLDVVGPRHHTRWFDEIVCNVMDRNGGNPTVKEAGVVVRVPRFSTPTELLAHLAYEAARIDYWSCPREDVRPATDMPIPESVRRAKPDKALGAEMLTRLGRKDARR